MAKSRLWKNENYELCQDNDTCGLTQRGKIWWKKIILILQTSPLYDRSCFGNDKKRLCNMNPCQRAVAIIVSVMPAHSVCLLSKWHSRYRAPNKTEKPVLWFQKHHRLTIPLVLCISHIKVGWVSERQAKVHTHKQGQEKNKRGETESKLSQRDFTRILCGDKQKTMVCF